MEIIINVNPLKEKRLFNDGIIYGYYSIMVDGWHRGRMWLSDEELERMREDYNIGLIDHDY
jgi:hypothetical protein